MPSFNRSPLLARPGNHPRPLAFGPRLQARTNFGLAGVSRDSSGAVLGSCTIKLFRTADDTLAAKTVSDASGNWSLPVMLSGPFYLVEYKAGSPDVAGTSVNTLVPTQV
jgi:hypothetical protein